MANLTINVDKIYKKHEKSINRSVGIEIDSDIRGLKYIIKGDSIIFTSILNGVFAIDMARIKEFTQELQGIGEMYGD